MILSFKPQFIHPIQVGTKIHTIREDKTNRWKPGRKIDFFTGRYTNKDRRRFAPSKECVSVQKIEIKWDDISLDWRTVDVLIDDRILSEKEIHLLAKRDGFTWSEDFLIWFNKDFTGKLIHWTDKNY